MLIMKMSVMMIMMLRIYNYDDHHDMGHDHDDAGDNDHRDISRGGDPVLGS